MKEFYCKCKRWRTYLLLFSAIIMSMVSFAQSTPCIDGVSNDWGDGGFMAGQSTYELNHDVFIGNNDDIFTGGKDFKDWGLPSPTPDYSNWTFSPMQAKSDIMNASAAIVTGLTPGDGCGGYSGTPYDPTHTYLFFAGDRESNKGTGYIGFWFCLNGTEPVDIGGDKYFAPEHFTNFGEDNGEGGTYDAETCAGDILILANFENGGRIADVTVLKWVGPGNGTEGNNLSLYPIGLTSQVGTNNDTPTPVPPGWIVTDGQTEYDYFEFFEGIVDLTPIFDLVGDPKILCKATWMLETRSSKEITADSKDFVGGNFNIAPTVEVSDDAVCEEGSASLTATLKDANGNPLSPVGYTFTWSGPGSFSGQGDTTITFSSAQLSDAGDYIVTVTSETFCEPDEPDTATLSVYDNPVCSVVTTDQSGFYAVDGTAKVNVTGAGVDTYYWTDGDGIAIPDANGQGTDSIWGLSMGRYYVYITDVNGCETSCDDSLGWVPTAPTCAVTPTPVTCFGGSDGSVEVYITSYPNVPPFTYILKDVSDNPLDTIVTSDTSAVFAGLTAGIYLFDVYDGIDPNATFCNGEITEPDEVTLTCPGDLQLGSCLTQDSVNTAFDNWLASVSSSGSDSSVTNNWNQVYPDACGDSITIRFTLDDPCLDPNYCDATFVVSDAPDVEYTLIESGGVGSCLTQDSVNSAYAAWFDMLDFSGGCNLDVDITNPGAPAACGGESTVMWVVSSSCEDTIRGSATFTVTPDLEAPVIAAPDDYELCNGELPKFIVAEWTDNCLGSGVDTAWMQTREDDDICSETADYYFMVEDSCGNVAMDTTTIVNRVDVYTNCETAFGKMAGEGANCFLDNGFDRWGWSNYIETGGQDTTVILTLWAGAAQCETDKGDSVGTVQVTYDAAGMTLTVEYLIADGYAMSEAHTYVGCGMFPLQKRGKSYVPTVAPGQFTVNAGSLEHSKNIIVTFTDVAENFYVIAHAVTCEEVCACSPRPGVDDGNTYDAVFDNTNCEDAVADSQVNTKKKKSADIVEPSLTTQSELKVYPNPFSDQVNIEFVSPVSGHAVLEIHNIAGQRVATLMDQYIEAGVEQKVQYRPISATSGVYLYKLDIDGNIQIGKIIYRNE